MSLSRRCLDGALLAAAVDAGATVLQGVSVDRLTWANGTWRVSLSDGRELSAPDAILATGKHDLRGFARPPGPQNDLLALKMYLRLQPDQAAALSGNVELLLYQGGYAGLQPVGEAANLCCLITRRQLAKLNGWPGLLRAITKSSLHAQERLEGAQPLLSKPLAVASIPYGFVRRHAPGERLWAVGDQAAVIPSFTGDGMSIALFTGLRAAQSLLSGETAEDFQVSLQRDLRAQVARATAISRGLVHPLSRGVMTGIVSLWPALLRVTAQGTRLSAKALAGVSEVPALPVPELSLHLPPA